MTTISSSSGTASTRLRACVTLAIAGALVGVLLACGIGTDLGIGADRWGGDYTDFVGLTRWLLTSISEPQFYAATAASVCLVLGGLLAQVAHRAGWRWQGFVQACGTGIWGSVAGAGLASLVLGGLAWGWTLGLGPWQPLFVPLVSVAPAAVVLYGPGLRVGVTAVVAGALLTTPVSIVAVEFVCEPWNLPPVAGATAGMSLGAVAAFWLCAHLPWMPVPGAWRAGQPAPVGQAKDASASSLWWVLRRALADFSEAQFYGNEWASTAMILGVLAAYAADPSGVAYGSGLLLPVLMSQALAALTGVVVWRHRWRTLGFYPTFVPVVSVAPATVLTYGGDLTSGVAGAMIAAVVAPPVAATISARLPSTFHPFVGNVASMSLCSALVVPSVGLIPGVSS